MKEGNRNDILTIMKYLCGLLFIVLFITLKSAAGLPQGDDDDDVGEEPDNVLSIQTEDFDKAIKMDNLPGLLAPGGKASTMVVNPSKVQY